MIKNLYIYKSQLIKYISTFISEAASGIC